MIIKVIYNNDILGKDIFWEGDSRDINKIRNIVAQNLANKVAIDGKTRSDGMWTVSEASHDH